MVLSLSVIVSVALVRPNAAPPTAFESTKVTVRFAFTTKSSTTGTVKVRVEMSPSGQVN